MARKILMDEAVRRFSSVGISDGIMDLPGCMMRVVGRELPGWPLPDHFATERSLQSKNG